MKSPNELKQLGIKLFCCCNLLAVVSCGVFENQSFSTADEVQAVVLGSIGNTSDDLFKNNFKIAALADYKSPIRVSVTPVTFSKSSYKIFLKARKYQMVNVNPQMNDSIKTKPKFVTVQIADRVALIDELNSSYNRTVKDYLNRQAKATLVTSISMALSQENINKIAQADVVFLAQNKLKDYVLQLHNGNDALETIKFNQGVVFAHKSSSSCWQENENLQLSIVDLVEGNTSCPPKTYKYAPRAIKKIDYFKF